MFNTMENLEGDCIYVCTRAFVYVSNVESKYSSVRLQPSVIHHGDQPVGITGGRHGVREEPDPGGGRQGVCWSPRPEAEACRVGGQKFARDLKVDLD